MELAIILFQIKELKTELQPLVSENLDLMAVCHPNIVESIGEDNRHVFKQFFIADNVKTKLFQVIEQNLNLYDEIVVLTTDEACLPIAAQAREYYNLRGAMPADIEKFINKVTMKDALLNSGIRHPKYLSFDKQQYLLQEDIYLQSIQQQIAFPIFVKPVDQYGSINAKRINTSNEFQSWAESIVEDGFTYEVDEFIDGQIFHCDSIIKDGKPIFMAAAEYNIPLAEFANGKPIGSIPLTFSDWRYSELQTFNEKVIQVLNPPDGGTHLEVFISTSGEIIFLEIAARSPGAYVVPVYQHCFAIDLEAAHYRVQIGLPVNCKCTKNNVDQAWLYLPNVEGTVMKLNSPHPNCNSQCDIKWLSKVEHHYNKSEDIQQNSVAAVVVLTNKNRDELYQDFISLTDFKFINIYPTMGESFDEFQSHYDKASVH